MKKYFFLLLIAVGIALPAHAQSQDSTRPAYNIYGRLDISLDKRSGTTATKLAEVDNASRLGIKGSKAFANGMTGLFGMEMGVSSDNGNFTSPAFRNVYAGLSGRYGVVALGRLDSSNPTGSPLYSQATRNLSFAVHDAGATAIGTSILNARNRTSNSIGYASPKIEGFTLRARRYTFGNEGTQSISAGGTTTVASPGTGLTEGNITQHDVGLSYENGAFSAGLGFSSDATPKGVSATAFKGKHQLVGSYDFGVAKVYAILGTDKYLNTAATRPSVDYRLIGVDIPIGEHRFVVNTMKRDVQTDKLGKIVRHQIAYSYKIDKDMSLYTTWDSQNPNTNLATGKFSTVSLGIQYNF